MPNTLTTAHEEKPLKIVGQADLNAERVQQMFKDIMRPSLMFQESIEKSFATQKKLEESIKIHLPAFENIAQQINAASEVFNRLQSLTDGLAIQKIAQMRILTVQKISVMRPPHTQFVDIPPPVRQEPVTRPEQLPAMSDKQFQELTAKLIDAIKDREDVELSNPRKKKGSIISVADGTSWEKIAIQFNDLSSATIMVNGEKRGWFKAKELGFRSDEMQTLQWRLLLVLSVYGLPGHKENPTVTVLRKALKLPTAQALHQIKTLTSKKLKMAFGIKEDPFYPYREKGFYLPRFKLEPVANLRGDGEIFIEGIEATDEVVYGKEKAEED